MLPQLAGLLKISKRLIKLENLDVCIHVQTMLIVENGVKGVTFPSMAAMLSKWAPPLERSTMATAIYAGESTNSSFAKLYI